MNNKLVSFIIPAYNEESALRTVFDSIPQEQLKKKGYSVELLLVDNNSTDRTVLLAKELGFKVIHEPIQGYGAAYKTGFSAAAGDIYVCGDCDGTYPFKESVKLLKKFHKENLKFITTNRFGNDIFKQKNMPYHRRIGNYLLSLLLRVFHKIKLIDAMSGMWVIDSNILKKVNLASDDMAFSPEIKIKLISTLHNSEWVEHDIFYNERIGDSKLNNIIDGLSSVLKIVSLK